MLWQEVVGVPVPAQLQDSFTYGGTLQHVSLPLDRLIGLVSTVGARFIKVKFGIVQDDVSGAPHFTLILFAADNEHNRLSSYYVSDEYWTGAASPAPGPLTIEVPTTLADTWLSNWHAVTTVTPELFQTAYGPLQGYTFDLGDFLDPLRHLPGANSELRLRFGLHQYFRPGPGGSDVEARTFGLVLQLHAAGQPATEPFFDISMPCPPTC